MNVTICFFFECLSRGSLPSTLDEFAIEQQNNCTECLIPFFPLLHYWNSIANPLLHMHSSFQCYILNHHHHHRHRHHFFSTSLPLFIPISVVQPFIVMFTNLPTNQCTTSSCYFDGRYPGRDSPLCSKESYE